MTKQEGKNMSEKMEILVLNNEINILKDKLAQKMVLRDHIQLHVCPNLDTDYILKFGGLNYEVYNYQVECEKIKMRISLMEKQLNRESQINLIEIDNYVDKKFAKKDDYLKEMSAKFNVVKNHGLKKELKGEEFKKLNKEYKDALLILHPDLTDYFDLTIENFLFTAIEAYEDYDKQGIKSVKIMALNTNHTPQKEKSSEELREFIDTLNIRIKLINKELIEIKESYPFNKKEFLSNENSVKSYKIKLTEEKENYMEEFSHYENIEHDILDKSHIIY